MKHTRPWLLTIGTAVYCWAAAPAVAADLPVACGAASCGSGGPGVWVTDGAASMAVTGTRMDITQTTSRAILNWAEFNIAQGSTVNFNQPGKSAIALNRIFQNDPSKIFGALTANGQVYLINQNGILFGNGARVNVGSLVASSLDIDPEAISGGILNSNLLANGKPAFASDRVFVLDAEGNVVTDQAGNPVPVKVVVEMGAEIRSAADGGGSVQLYGQDVENAGKIEAPSGQVILAAGQKVYLQASDDPNLRGLLVEVDAGGEAWNKATGQIASALGNVTLLGLAVNQQGRVSASTSVLTNGSVRLLARDTVSVDTTGGAGNIVVRTGNAGSVTLGEGSLTEVTLDPRVSTAKPGGETAVDDQAQPGSTVEVQGRQITLASGSTIRAKGGEVSLSALPNPAVTRPVGEGELLPADPASRIRLESGSLIDVSGADATVSVSRNAVDVELRANELRDSPLQRDGALRGETVTVDLRKGTPLADVSGATAQLKRGVEERNSAGGSVLIESRGDVVQAEGATIDVSGGVVNYTGGVVQTSRLVTADGKSVDISEADPNRIYRGVDSGTTTKTYQKWGVVKEIKGSAIGLYDPGYVEGKDAGTVSIAAPGLVLNGTLAGHTVNGQYQRDPATRALGGELVIGLADGQGVQDYRAPSIHFTNVRVPVDVDPGEALPDDWTRLELPTDYLVSGGFTRSRLFSNGSITIDEDTPLALADGSVFALTAANVDIGSDVRSAGGRLAFSSVEVTPGARLLPDERPGLLVRDGVALDVSGRWLNDSPDLAGRAPLTPLFIDAGVIDLRVTAPTRQIAGPGGETSTVNGELRLGDGVALTADAGAFLAADGGLEYGRAGSLSVRAGVGGSALATGRDLRLSAYGFSSGGTLTLEASQLAIGGNGSQFAAAQVNDPLAADTVPYAITADFFRTGGFQDFRLLAAGNRLGAGNEAIEPITVLPGAVIEPRAEARTLDAGFARVASGSDLAEFTTVTTLPDYARKPANLALTQETSSAGDLVISEGSRITTDAGGRVDLVSSGRIRIDGTMETPAGQISARVRAATPDAGYDPAVGIQLGNTGRLDARGTLISLPNDAGLRSGTVLDAGRVTLSAERGGVELAAGSTVDVSGATAVLDIATGAGTPLETRRIGSSGGTVSLFAAETMALDGALTGVGGAQDAGRSEGGALSVQVSRQPPFSAGGDLLPTFPTSPRQILVTTEAAPAGGDESGTVRFDPGRVEAGGFDSLRLAADDRILFAGGSSLAVANALRLESRTLGSLDGSGTVSLAANYLAIGPRATGFGTAGTANGGGATLEARAGLVDFFGTVALDGFDRSAFTADEDIRFSGLYTSSQAGLAGSLQAAGSLGFTARQLYPTTHSTYAITVVPGSGGESTLAIAANGRAASPVYSAGGSLSLQAHTIRQGGVLLAPLGQLTLTGEDQVNLLAGSVTSTSANGLLIPFGRVSGGSEWLYEIAPGVFDRITAPLAKRITLDGAEVGIADGAKVDIAGGGDLYGYEFLPGPGGSVDALTAAANPNLFAIVPALANSFSPLDTQEQLDGPVIPGESVYLDGVPGLLAAGTYAILPSRYALLPGAVLVEALPGTTDFATPAPLSLPDGAAVVAGYRTLAGTGIRDGRTSGFAVRPGSYARRLAEYQDSRGSDFFAKRAAGLDQAAPLLARDAGDLRIVVGQTLELAGDLAAGAATGGRGARVDISADDLRVVAATGGNGVAGAVEVSATELNALGAESLLLGGTREATATGITVTPEATSVTLASGVALSGREVTLVARDDVTLEEGARLESTGAPAAAATATSEAIQLAGTTGSALVRVSEAAQATISRDAGAAAAGDVRLAAGSRVAARGSVAVDAAGTARSEGVIDGAAGSVLLGSNRIVLGADQGAVPDALAVSGADFARYGTLGELQLKAGGSIDVAGPVTLGDAADRPDRLVVDAPRVTGQGADATLAAGTVVLRNSGVADATPVAGGSGQLTLRGEDVVIADGRVGITGFGTVELAGTRAIRGSGDATLASGGNLTLAAPVITADAGADLAIRAAGQQVELRQLDASGVATAGLGGSLDVEAGSIQADTRVLLPAGRVRLAATGDLTLGDHASLDVSGRSVRLGPASATVDGGSVTLVARNGDVAAAGGSRVDVSAAAAGGRAGAVSILAGGTATLDGTLAGNATRSGDSGSIALVTGQLAASGQPGSLAALNDSLDEGGFNRAREVEVLTGDVSIDVGNAMKADKVVLAASGGSLTVDGTVGSGAAGGGTVTLAARDDLTVGARACVGACTAGTGQRPPADVLLSSTGGDVAVDGAVRTGGGGLRVRAAATGDDMRITSLAGDLTDVGQLVLEPVTTASVGPVIDGSVTADLKAGLDGYMAVAPAMIRDRLGPAAAGALVRPGLELQATGDLTLASDWSLTDWRYDGEAGYLVIRAPGAIQLNGSLSDAFTVTGTGANQVLNVVPGSSWSLGLAAGADLGSVLSLATAGRQFDGRAGGDLVLGNGRVIRTGTGDIAVAADGNIAFGNDTSLIYTAGQLARPTVLLTSGLQGGGRSTRYWLRDGGDIALAAGQDILGVATNQVMSGWNVRTAVVRDGVTLGAEWSVDINRFRQGVAALGGGDLSIVAGRNIDNLAATVLTTGAEQLDADGLGTGVFDTYGGGDLSVVAGGNINSGVYSAWEGDARLVAGGSLGTARTLSGRQIFPILAAGPGTVSVAARRDLVLGGVINPTTVSPLNTTGNYFYSYGTDDSLSLVSTGGDLRLLNDLQAFGFIVRDPAGQPNTAVASRTSTFGVYAPNLLAAAPSGNIGLGGVMRLLPSPTGTLDLLAAKSVTAIDSSLVMSDADPTKVPAARRPVANNTILDPVKRASGDAIHVGDARPVRIVAAGGDVAGGSYSLPKHFEVYAARDVRDVAVRGQNTSTSQVSSVVAGRKLSLSALQNELQVAGPGRLQVLAGSGVDLGFSGGITTIGRSANPLLPGDGGADLDLWVGIAGEPAYQAFNAKYWDENFAREFDRYTSGDPDFPSLVEYVASVTARDDVTPDNVWSAWAGLESDDQSAFLTQLQPEDRITFQSFTGLVDTVVDYVALVTGQEPRDPTDSVVAYLALAADSQRPLVQDYFFRELRDSGREANLGEDLGFRRGQDAIATLFPEARQFAGDLSLAFSRIYTLDGGDITLLAPGGLVNVGLARAPEGCVECANKQPSDLGIVTQGPGDVRIFADDDILVNQSRVFTLKGGDIVMWSSNGDIDAGRGSKSAISAPPPTITVSPDGVVSLAFSDAIAGSGIRGIITDASIEPGDVDLVAPTGTVNAGDAGIGAAGNLNIAAPQVVGLDNIQVGGLSTGVPTDSGGIASSLTGVSSLGSSAAEGATDAVGNAAGGEAPMADEAMGWLDVFVEGFGTGKEEEDEEEKAKRRKKDQ